MATTQNPRFQLKTLLIATALGNDWPPRKHETLSIALCRCKGYLARGGGNQTRCCPSPFYPFQLKHPKKNVGSFKSYLLLPTN